MYSQGDITRASKRVFSTLCFQDGIPALRSLEDTYPEGLLIGEVRGYWAAYSCLPSPERERLSIMVPRLFMKFPRDLVFVFNDTEVAGSINHYAGIADKPNCTFELGGAEFKHAPHLAFSVRRFEGTTAADFPYGQLLADYGSTFIGKNETWATSYDEEAGPFPEDSTGGKLLARLAASERRRQVVLASPSSQMGGGGTSSSSSAVVASSSSSSSSSSEVASSYIISTINVGFWDAISLQSLEGVAGDEQEDEDEAEGDEGDEEEEEQEEVQECPGCEDEIGPFLEQHLKSLNAEQLGSVTTGCMVKLCAEEFLSHCPGKAHKKFIKKKSTAVIAELTEEQTSAQEKKPKKSSSTPARKPFGGKSPRSAVKAPAGGSTKKRFALYTSHPFCLY